MKINVNQQLKQFNGKPLKKTEDDSPALLADFLLIAVQSTKTENVIQSQELWKLGTKIAIASLNGGDVELTVAECDLLQKGLLGLPPLVSGQAIELLEGVKNEPAKPD